MAALVLLVTADCTGEGKEDGKHSRTATITVDKPVALADEPVHVRISGLASGEEVTVTTHATDVRDMAWSGRAVFTADAMGLFWSMVPSQGDPDASSFEPATRRSPLPFG